MLQFNQKPHYYYKAKINITKDFKATQDVIPMKSDRQSSIWYAVIKVHNFTGTRVT